MIHEAVILSTGDEITTGRIVDTNSNYIADKLAEAGIEVVAVLTVGDVPERLEWAWKAAMTMADVVISTGGIGPTADDLTNETVGRITGKKLVRDQESVDHGGRIVRYAPGEALVKSVFASAKPAMLNWAAASVMAAVPKKLRR